MIPLLLTALLASADIPPPEGYVETCTVENHQKEGMTCKKCDAYHGGRKPCEALEKKGYVRVCRTGGASVWDEVMCKKGEDDGLPAGVIKADEAAPEAPEPPPDPSAAPPSAPDAAPAKSETTPEPPTEGGRCSHLAPAMLPVPLLLVAPLLLRRRRR